MFLVTFLRNNTEYIYIYIDTQTLEIYKYVNCNSCESRPKCQLALLRFKNS